MNSSGTWNWQELTVTEILAEVIPQMLERLAANFDEIADSYPAALAGHGRNRLIAAEIRKTYKDD